MYCFNIEMEEEGEEERWGKLVRILALGALDALGVLPVFLGRALLFAEAFFFSFPQLNHETVFFKSFLTKNR